MQNSKAKTTSTVIILPLWMFRERMSEIEDDVFWGIDLDFGVFFKGRVFFQPYLPPEKH